MNCRTEIFQICIFLQTRINKITMKNENKNSDEIFALNHLLCHIFSIKYLLVNTIFNYILFVNIQLMTFK